MVDIKPHPLCKIRLTRLVAHNDLGANLRTNVLHVDLLQCTAQGALLPHQVGAASVKVGNAPDHQTKCPKILSFVFVHQRQLVVNTF